MEPEETAQLELGGEDDAFSKAFDEMGNKAAADKAKPVEVKKEKAPPDQEAKGAQETKEEERPAAEDLWANLSDEQKAAIGQMNRETSEWKTRALNDANRISTFQKKLDEAERAKAPAPTRTKAFQKMQEDYPDIAGAVEEELNARVAAVTGAVAERLAPVAQMQSEAYLAKQEQILQKLHPDYQDVIETPEFASWKAEQTRPRVLEMLDSNDAEDAAWLLGAFKQSVAAAKTSPVADIQAQRRNRIAQAASPQVARGAARQSRADVPETFDAAWDEFGRRA